MKSILGGGVHGGEGGTCAGIFGCWARFGRRAGRRGGQWIWGEILPDIMAVGEGDAL